MVLMYSINKYVCRGWGEGGRGGGGIFYLLRRVVGQRPVDYYVAELPQVHGTSILGMNLNCLYAGPRA